MPSKARAASLKLLYISSVFSFLYLYPGVDELEITDMLFHMLVEHFLFISAGFLILSVFEDIITGLPIAGSQLMQDLRRLHVWLILANKKINRYGIFGLTTSAAILGFWHIPDILVIGTLDEFLHEIMHISYMVMGGLIYMSVKQISRTKLALILIGFCKVMLWSGLYLSMTDTYVYKLYPLWQHHLVGEVKLWLVPFMEFGAVAYLLHNIFKREELKEKILNK